MQEEDTKNRICCSRLLDQRKEEGENEWTRKGSDYGQKPSHFP